MVKILLIVLAVALVGVAALRIKVRSVRARHRRRIAAVDPEHTAPANLIGVASEGTPQVRGLGTLVLGATHVVFVQLVPERDITVPREAITSARATRHFLGKTTESDLLVVTWDVQGMGDAMALAVPDVDAWRDRLA